MKLELEPIEGERVISKEEREWREKRMRPISPDVLRQFNNGAENSIKIFLIRLITLTQQFHNDVQDHDDCTDEQQEFFEEESKRINNERQALFNEGTPSLKEFIKVLNLFPMEGWQEFEALIKILQDKDLSAYRELSHSTGISAAMDNAYLMQIENDIEEEHMEQIMKSKKITPSEIETLIMRHSLEEIVGELINARKIGTGDFWKDSFYNL